MLLRPGQAPSGLAPPPNAGAANAAAIASFWAAKGISSPVPEQNR